MTSSSSRRSSISSSDSHPIFSSLSSLPAPRDSFVQLSSSSGSSRFRTSSVVSPGPASASSLSSASSVDSPGSSSSSSSSSGLSCPGCSRVLPNDKALIAHVNEHVAGAFVGAIPSDALLDRGYEACGQCHKFYKSGGGIASHKRACDRHLVSVPTQFCEKPWLTSTSICLTCLMCLRPMSRLCLRCRLGANRLGVLSWSVSSIVYRGRTLSRPGLGCSCSPNV